jgi:hypothetical protein
MGHYDICQGCGQLSTEGLTCEKCSLGTQRFTAKNPRQTDPKKENKQLRQLIWLTHGCPIASLYGDDGEMQCGRCLIDFKRATVGEIRGGLSKKG